MTRIGQTIYADGMRSQSPGHVNSGAKRQWDTTGVLLDESAAAGGLIDFAGVFGNKAPVEMEIGTGKGTFLLERATQRPELNFLGVEWAKVYCHYSADRFRRAGLQNVRMLRTDAMPFLTNCIADNSILRLHVYFPDPWPKKRHRCRRLIQPGFVKQARRILMPGGQLIVVTDHMDYFEQIRRVMRDAPGLASTPLPRMSDKSGEIVGTNFERKYIAQGRAFYGLAAMKYV